jgi:1,4-dihydroxy-2-naphthoate octaprenyltransferase
MRKGIIITTTIACIIGLPLIYYGGSEMIIIGFICVIFCFLYTTKLSYLGLGDLLVLVFFGIIPVCLTYYVIVPGEKQHVTIPVFLASLGCGLIIDTLLVINNFRDRENDKEAEKITLVVRIGEKWGYNLYKIVGSTGYIFTLIALFLEGMQSAKTLLIVALCLQIPFAILNDMAFRKMGKIWKGKELNKILDLTARNMLIYGLFSTIGIIILSF